MLFSNIRVRNKIKVIQSPLFVFVFFLFFLLQLPLCMQDPLSITYDLARHLYTHGKLLKSVVIGAQSHVCVGAVFTGLSLVCTST